MANFKNRKRAKRNKGRKDTRNWKYISRIPSNAINWLFDLGR